MCDNLQANNTKMSDVKTSRLRAQEVATHFACQTAAAPSTSRPTAGLVVRIARLSTLFGAQGSEEAKPVPWASPASQRLPRKPYIPEWSKAGNLQLSCDQCSQELA